MRALKWYIARPRLAVAVAVVLTLVSSFVDVLLIRSATAPTTTLAATAQHATTGVSSRSLSESFVATLPDFSATCVWIGDHRAC